MLGEPLEVMILFLQSILRENMLVRSMKHCRYRCPFPRLRLLCFDRISVANLLALTIGGKGDDAGGVSE